MAKLQKIIIMAGGTGGHVFPGLAVAKALRKQGVDVHWLGTRKGLEARLVPENDIPLHFISISGLRGKGWKDIFFAPFKLLWAIAQSLRVIHQLKPDVILGMGGFVSGPGGIAGWLLRRPLVVHEQNAKAGLTNKWLSHVAAKVLEGFPNTFPTCSKAVTTGNPVRLEIADLPSPEIRFQEHNDRLRLLVIGGSLGADAFNQLLPTTLATLPEEERPLIYHQAGEKHCDSTIKAYKAAKVKAEIVPFIADMQKAYAWADVVLCRAGALTVAELCAAGIGSILVPYPYAVDDHQTANANYLVKNNAAVLMQQSGLTASSLLEIIKKLSQSPTQRIDMAKAAYQLRNVDATSKVLKICEEVCH